MTEGKAGLRLRVLAGLVAFMFAALSTRLWFLQVLATERLREEAKQNAVRLVQVPAPRGRILDADGDLLVKNRTSIQVTINRQEAGDQEEQVLFNLSKLLGVPARVLSERLENPQFYAFTPVPVAVDVSKRMAYYIGEHPDEFPGVDWVPTPVRIYAEGTLAAHVLGYLRQISPEQVEDPGFADYGLSDLVGQAGVEAVYEQQLRGTNGYVKYRVNAAGKNLGEIGYQGPSPGNDLVLTIDDRIQRLAEESLAYGMERARAIFDDASGRDLRANAGAVIVMDPNTGAILALASAPTYDPSIFVGSVSEREFARLTGPAAGRPLFDRAIQGEYPPGSTFKPFIALSAFSRDVASPGGYYNCPAQYIAPGDESGTVFHNWSSVSRGLISMTEALTISCDTVFYQFGWEYWLRYFHSPNKSAEPLQRDLRTFSFGSPTNIDLPEEHAGRVPDAEWKREIHDEEPKLFPYGDWFPGDYINMTIGQGDTLVTPLQLATAFSAIANGGRVCVPHVGLGIQSPDGSVVRQIKPRCNERLPFTAGELAFVRDALAKVPVSGTAATAFRGFPFSEVPVAGKTGTAEVRPFQDYSWFAAMAPAYDPQYVVLALVEQGGHGSTTAAPIVRNIIEGLFGLPQSGFVSGGVSD